MNGGSALETKDDLDAVRKVVKERLKELKRNVVPARRLTDAEKVALAEGNSTETIAVNKEKYNYDKVEKKYGEKVRLMAEKWYMAPKPSSSFSRGAYDQWRVWNVAKTQTGKDVENYRGGLIIEKATGKSVSPPESPEWESEEDEEETEVEEVTEEVTVAMAAVRVE
jgi:hypothetical protein